MRHLLASVFALAATLAASAQHDIITLATLLHELTSPEANASLPERPYRCLQSSSYDRHSVSPDSDGWFANEDGYGIIRTDTIDGRTERVMLDTQRPGVITRFWITTLRKNGTLRFYFDGERNASLVVPAYDLSLLPIRDIIGGLVLRHTSYTPQGKGGETCFLPIPFAHSCKVTFEDAPGIAPSPKYYQINYREYADGANIETFSLSKATTTYARQISATNWRLQHPGVERSDCASNTRTCSVAPHGTARLHLPSGMNAVYQLALALRDAPHDAARYAQLMRHIIVQATFDGEPTVWCPLSDFSAGGMGAPEVRSYFLNADGRGTVTSNWLMPYKENADISLYNISDSTLTLSLHALTAPLPWTPRSMHFHTSWRQTTALQLTSNPDRTDECSEWQFCSLTGHGIYKGDALTVYNDSRAWYGEGDEKIWVDHDTFPSHFGTGTEDYYNSSWAPVYVFHTPFGGAPRADQASSHGYNTFFRTRCLDGIPFDNSLRFDLELLSWVPGKADFASTVYWYGTPHAYATGCSAEDEAGKALHPLPDDLSKWTRPHCTEFEALTPDNVSSKAFNVETQNMLGFVDGTWSGATQLVLTGCKSGDNATFGFACHENRPYGITLYMTQASDYGITAVTVNGKRLAQRFDGYNNTVTCTPFCLGSFRPVDGKITITFTQDGTNKASAGTLIGLDCISLQ